MYQITVITPSIGRKSIYKLAQSLAQSSVNIKILHLILWDSKRCEDGISPHDLQLEKLTNPNYTIHHYVITHPIYNIERKDNWLRVIGMMMSTTPYITHMGDDCWVEPNWFANGINNIESNPGTDYTFCRRNIWLNTEIKLGIDDYESIGIKNKFGYYLMENDSIIFTKKAALTVAQASYNSNGYYADREITKALIQNFNGVIHYECGLNQISPDFLVAFHKQNIKN